MKTTDHPADRGTAAPGRGVPFKDYTPELTDENYAAVARVFDAVAARRAERHLRQTEFQAGDPNEAA